MLLEFDADQRLWQDTVRDAVGKQCPPSLVREVAENGVDPAPLWQAYIDAGWTELTDPENAVELAIVLEELGRATDPTPFLATLTQFAPLVGDRFDPQQRGRGRSTTASPPTATPTAGCSTEPHATSSTATGPTGSRWSPTAASSSSTPATVTIRRSDGLRPGAARRRGVVRRRAAGRHRPAARRRGEGPPSRADRAWRSRWSARASASSTWCSNTSSSRQQFGVAIGSFQAVQHKAADMHVAIERARALSYFAALTIAADDPRRRLAAAMAKASAGECQALVFRHGLQLFGAMGFTWENDLQFALKRAKAGELMLGGAAEHRAIDRGGIQMQLTFDSDVEEFRAEFSAFLDEHLPREAETLERPRSVSHMPQWARDWQRLLFDNGWLLPAQPPEFGGRNATVLQQYVHLDELCRRRIYHSFNPQGVNIIAASLISFGTDEQKHRWAVPVLKGELTASLGMSEPSAGSDLASLRTRAVRSTATTSSSTARRCGPPARTTPTSC